MKIAVAMRGETQRRQAALSRVDPELFVQFPDESLLRRFSLMNLAAGKLPKPGHRLSCRAARKQDPSLDTADYADIDLDLVLVLIHAVGDWSLVVVSDGHA